MKLRSTFVLFILVMLNLSCENLGMDKMIIESFIRDDMTNQPIDNVYISVDAIKSSQGMGDFISGRREDAGEAKTNSQGYYKLTLRVFKMLKDLNSELMRGMKELD